MADFDAIYEDSSADAGAGGGYPGAAASGEGSSGGSGYFLDESHAPAALMPDPVIVRGAGNITV